MARVLLVEDSQPVGSTLADMIESFGHKVDHSMTVLGAVLRVSQEHYDLVLMDNFLAGSSGTIGALALRGIGYGGTIVRMSAIMTEIEPNIAAIVRFAGEIAKPVTLEQMRVELEKYLGSGGIGNDSNAK